MQPLFCSRCGERCCWHDDNVGSAASVVLFCEDCAADLRYDTDNNVTDDEEE